MLVFVVAYEAESTLRPVLARIPDDVFDRCDTEVLVIDDSSTDHTFDVGLRTASDSRHPITILYNPVNQGYGGNQKLGYQYAIRNSFDFVVLLHGDGQYAPEYIPAMLAPLMADEADAVFGSRMLARLGALKGGMPLYKFVGNRILTWIQNNLLGTTLSEFHSGFRAYRVSSLRRVPFQYNSNAFHFDTDIIIQLVAGRHRMVEIPIPTYYGTEICRVNGLRYAKDVVTTTLASRWHSMNVFYNRKFDVQDQGNTHYALKLGYQSSHTMAFRAVPSGARSWISAAVLDSSPNFFARNAQESMVPINSRRWMPSVFNEFFLWREGDVLDADLRDYDVVLLLDIIEHLKNPAAFLDQLRQSANSIDRRPSSSSRLAMSCSASSVCRRSSVNSTTGSAASWI